MSRPALERKEELERDLAALERQIYELESRYLGLPSNLVVGWSRFAQPPAATGRPAPDSSRIFSLSSRTSPLGAASEWSELRAPPPFVPTASYKRRGKEDK